ncbi:MAG: ATP-binding cassette domain-containing protein [Nitrospinota bacterium]|nr:ATP-binding cassette domain-containing protein [Nitrospinota bacterium]
MTQQNSRAALETRGISFTYQEGTKALLDVDFIAQDGKFTALLASNGSGKTTLLKALVGLIKPQTGQVLVEGGDIRSMSSARLYGKVGMVFQNPDDQLFAPTVAEDVAFGPRNMDLPEAEVKARVEEALFKVCAGHLAGKAVHHLSYGEKKRVALAGTLAMGPKILILDEPTAGLDPMGEEGMTRLLSDLNRESGVTVVLATHSIDLLPLFADRIFVLKNGRAIMNGTAEEIFRDQEMLKSAGLRLPYVSALLHQLKHYDGVPINGLPLTIGEARKRMLEHIPESALVKSLIKEPDDERT